MAARLKFICPHCGREGEVEEMVRDVTVIRIINMSTNADYTLEHLESDEYESDKFVYYRCPHCTCQLFNAAAATDARLKLYEYLLRLPCNHEIGENNAEG